METLVIDRKTWLHGEGAGSSALLRSTDGKMCCLGFYALQFLGAGREDIMDNASPTTTRDGLAWPETLVPEVMPHPKASHICLDLMDINDERDMKSDEQREQLIEKHFAEIGVRVIFKGEY